MSKKTKVVMGPYAIEGSKADILAMIEQMTSDLGSITQEDLDASAERSYLAQKARNKAKSK